MLVFKSLTNPCLIGRDILAAHPETKDHFQAIMGQMNDKTQNTMKSASVLSKQQKNKSSDDEQDETTYAKGTDVKERN